MYKIPDISYAGYSTVSLLAQIIDVSMWCVSHIHSVCYSVEEDMTIKIYDMSKLTVNEQLK